MIGDGDCSPQREFEIEGPLLCYEIELRRQGAVGCGYHTEVSTRLGVWGTNTAVEPERVIALA